MNFFVLDHTYEEFYGKGKKNHISHTKWKLLPPKTMNLTREGK